MHCLPLTSDGERSFNVELSGVTYNFRSYYVLGQKKKWLLDIRDANDEPLVLGMPIIPGAINAVKGYGNILDGVNALVFAAELDQVDNADALGNGLTVFWYPPDDPDYNLTNDDPMDDVGATFGYEWGA